MNDTTERARIEQSNDVAGIVSIVGRSHDMFMHLHLRYDIADALYDAGYRKVQASGGSES